MVNKLLNSTSRRKLINFIIIAVGIAVLVTVVFVLQIVRSPSPVDQKSAPTDGKTVTIGGVMMCLPHKNTSGPQTDECAYGLKADDGTYYAIRDTDPLYGNISRIPMNQRVRVSGTFHAETSNIYPTIGTISVKAIAQ